MPSSSANVSGESVNRAAAKFSRRCATEDVPGINRIFGDRCSSQASATCIGVVRSRSATVDRVDDCSGVKPPSGKNGTPLPGQIINQGIVLAMGQVMVVLHANDIRDRLRLRRLRGRDVLGAEEFQSLFLGNRLDERGLAPSRASP